MARSTSSIESVSIEVLTDVSWITMRLQQGWRLTWVTKGPRERELWIWLPVTAPDESDGGRLKTMMADGRALDDGEIEVVLLMCDKTLLVEKRVGTDMEWYELPSSDPDKSWQRSDTGPEHWPKASGVKWRTRTARFGARDD